MTTNEATAAHERGTEAYVGARPAGFWWDLRSVAGRALRAVPREPEALVPALIIPLFFFAVNVGALSGISSFTGVDDFKAFRCPSPSSSR